MPLYVFVVINCVKCPCNISNVKCHYNLCFHNNNNNNRAQYVFQPQSVENLGPFSSSTLDFLRDLGRRISHISGDDREVLFLFQRISVTIQRFNFVLLHDSFSIDQPDLYSHSASFYLLFLTLGISTTKG